VDEAISLANRWQAQGECQWFRGQKEPWPLRSTLSRVRDTWAEAEAIERMVRFVELARTDDALAWLLDESYAHAFFGCLQHYGIPTHYIDFSRSPAIAAFFATNNPAQEQGKDACIYCFETEFLETVLAVVKKRNELPPTAYPEIVRVDIPDLLRMRAQEGEFLYCPAPGMERLFAPRAIVFPFQTPYSGVATSDVYPLDKSPLERHLEAIASQVGVASLYRWLDERDQRH
jgi:hypothetical protein